MPFLVVNVTRSADHCGVKLSFLVGIIVSSVKLSFDGELCQVSIVKLSFLVGIVALL